MLRPAKIFGLAVAVLISGIPAFTQNRKPVAIEDLYRLKGVSGLSLSPDGTKLLLQVSSQDINASKRNSNVWLINTTNGEYRQITYSDKSNFSPFWSSDGKTIYFSSNREGGLQLWRISLDGGEAARLTSFAPGAGSPKLLPSGNQVIFTASVFPEAGADAAKNTELLNKLETGPVQAHLADGLLERHWDSWRDFQYTHLFRASFSGGVEAITSGKTDFPAYGQSFDVSPDGKEICAVTNIDEVTALSTNQDLFLISLDGNAKPRRITTNKAFDGDPKYSPDGKWIAYRLQKRPGAESDRFRLAVLDRSTMTERVLTESIDNWVENIRWAPDSKSIYFTIHEKGRTPLCRVDIATGAVSRIIESRAIREYAVSPDQKTIFFTSTSVEKPVEVYAFNTASKAIRQVTKFNEAVVAEVDFRPAEEIWVKGAAGKDIHVFIVKPHGFDPAKKYPLIMNVHGGPQMQWMDSFRGDWQVYPGAGYIVAFPNPHGSTGYGQEFTDAISGDWNGKVMTDVLNVAEHLSKLPYVDQERMGAMGWSWGGYAMMWLEGRETPFKALAAMMGVYDLRSMHGTTEELWFPQEDIPGTPWDNPGAYEERSPSNYVKNYKTPCLVITGERDYRVPYTQSLQFFTDLQLMKVPSRLIVFKNDGHWPDDLKSMPVYYNAHLEWFHQWLGGGSAPWKTEDMIRNLRQKP
ncbi:MAG: S9 family peptidase [Holophagales bacterium]|jgi:dipeptidyl aminopeptidase/acylaminoacyl peptidase|nr:S9 family peptidase [Holophagales bacterium]